MTFWWKMGIALAVIVAVLDAGYYIRGRFDEAAQADLLRGQIKAANERMAEQNAVAKKTESELQASRQAFATLNKKWTTIRAQKDRTVCQLDAGALGVLREADRVSGGTR